MNTPPLFQQKMLRTALERFDLAQIPNLAQKREILTKWKQIIESGKLKQAGEVALHGDFLGDLFGMVLDYGRMTDGLDEWNLAQEQKTLLDATKADGALGFFTQEKTDIRGIIELKSATADLDAKQSKGYQKQTPVEQAFGYAPKHGKKCQWVLVSNYLELRLYHASSQVEYERFVIADLTNEQEFKRFYVLLAREHLLTKDGVSPIEALYRKSEDADARISKQFYADYTTARLHLFEHLKAQNPSTFPQREHEFPSEDKTSEFPSQEGNLSASRQHELFLLEKTQKLLDRFIFICFCEDTGMLPARTFRNLLKQAQNSFVFMDAEHEIWSALKGLFKSLDKGWKEQNIPQFNGELFKPDEDLDALVIGDEIFTELAAITDYDFESELNVNILGHIFEQSISDLEDLRAGIRGEELDRKQGKRKKEGVFYTPEYITRSIVEQAVGGWLDDRKQELGIDELPELTQKDIESVRLVKTRYKGNKKVEQHRAFWEAYREKLANITVLDPACGSGAFLNQAFRFLYREGEQVNNNLADLSQGQRSAFDLHKHILSHNLYGVDINKESAEITKLSLWLLTARKDSQLTALDDNIKCGNSLIDDPLLAGEKAFKWEDAFSDIMGNGGFDVVIGNPPYLAGREWNSELRSQRGYFLKHYRCMTDQYDLYALFIQKTYTLLGDNGKFSFITPNTWFNNDHYLALRRWVVNKFRIESVGDYRNVNVFVDATVLPVVFVFSKINSIDENNNISIRTFQDENIFHEFESSISIWRNSQNTIFNLATSQRDLKILEKIENKSLSLSKLGNIRFGGKVYQKGKGKPRQNGKEAKQKIFESVTKIDTDYFPYLRGKNLHRWRIDKQLNFLKYGVHLAEPRAIELFEGERVLVRRIVGDRLILTPITETIIADQLIHTFKPTTDSHNYKFIAAILGCELTSFYLKKKYNRTEKTFPEIRVGELASLPIIDIPKIEQQVLIEKVDRLLEFNTQLHADTQKFLRFIESSYQTKKLSTKLYAFHTLEFKEFVKELKKQKVTLTKQEEFELLDLFEAQKSQALAQHQQIERTDGAIDRMVYDLYGLTEEDIRIVEGK